MKLRNTTDIPNHTIREITNFVKPVGIHKFDIFVKNSQYHYYGRCYPKGCLFHNNSFPLIVIRINKSEKKPFSLPNPNSNKTIDVGKGYRKINFYTKKEALVAIIAHELRHLWQAQKGKKRCNMAYGLKGTYSEIDASAYEIRMLRKWRKK